MKKILGLDLGVASIGWAYILEDETGTANSLIKGIGSRIIPLSTDENDEFTKGNAISKNMNRTMKRSARRNQHRYKMRKHFLNKLFEEQKWTPDPFLFCLDATNLYGLRDRALKEKISLKELARIFYHLNQKRGYKSNRKANNEEQDGKKQSEYLSEIAAREAEIKEQNLTIGQYFFKKLQENPWYQIKENIFLRASYINEFDQIWDKQKVYYPEILIDTLRDQIRDRIIYYQRPLRSQKGLVSECRFELHHKVAPKSSPIFQVCKVWESINNITFKDKYGKQSEITLDQKQKIFAYLDIHEKITATELRKMLGLGDGYYPNALILKKGIEGNRTKALFIDACKKTGIDPYSLVLFNLQSEVIEKTDKTTGEIKQITQINSSFIDEPLYKLWHKLYSIEEDENLIAALKDFELDEQQAKVFMAIDFKKGGFGNKSARAIRRILPYLEKGFMYSEACNIAGYNHSDSITKKQNEERILKERLDLIQKNSLRNPVVEKILNQLVNLVNAIIDDPELGKPDEIRVELARELKQNIDERNRTYKNNNDREKEHKKIIDRLQNEYGIKRITRSLIEKVKLYEETDGISVYSGKKIELARFINGEGVEVEHIIPRARLFDDSFQNKAICETSINKAKDNSTAFDYMQTRSKEEFAAYIEIVNDLYKRFKISRTKRDKLLMSAKDIPEDFIDRQLRETQYIAREAKALLTEVCRNVYATSGSVTDYLRHNWGYDEILKNLNWDKYEKAGKVETFFDEKDNKHKKRIIDWSKRDDHRHHAIDAIVIACTKQSYIQQLNKLNQYVEWTEDETRSLALKKIDIKNTVPFSTAHIEEAAKNILVSFKAGKRVAVKSFNKKTGQTSFTPRGFLHKETVYGSIKQFEKVKLNQRFSRVDDISDKHIKAIIHSHLINYNNDPKLAFSSKTIEKTPELKGITDITVFKTEFVVRYPLDINFKYDDVKAIVNKGVKKAIIQRLSEYGNNPKEAFKDLDKNPVWLNKEKQIPIKNVRCFTGLTELQPLHKNDENEPVDFVSTRNNHHIAIYKDQEGKLHENIVTFWQALERKKANIPVIVRDPKKIWDSLLNLEIDKQDLLSSLPKDDWTYITSMQQNEMFIFNMNEDELLDAIKENQFDLISPNLYKVQKISSMYYNFRHHLDTSVKEIKELKDENWKRISSLSNFNPIKVSLNNLGKILKIDEKEIV